MQDHRALEHREVRLNELSNYFSVRHKYNIEYGIF